MHGSISISGMGQLPNKPHWQVVVLNLNLSSPEPCTSKYFCGLFPQRSYYSFGMATKESYFGDVHHWSQVRNGESVDVLSVVIVIIIIMTCSK